MYLIVGLGNPEKKYDNTYHNAGFMFIDELCEQNGIELSKQKCKSLLYEGHLFGKKVVLAKPLTYMNRSGEAVVELVSKFKPEHLVIVYDDIDIEKGTIRFREKGSAGTHNGMRSIVELMGTEKIERLRIGTKSEQKVYDLADYVLSKMNMDTLEKIDSAIQNGIELIKEKIEKE